MKALWRKYFYIPPDCCISDRVFIARLTLHVALIVLCLACMAYSAYALFSCDISSTFYGDPYMMLWTELPL